MSKIVLNPEQAEAELKAMMQMPPVLLAINPTALAHLILHARMGLQHPVSQQNPQFRLDMEKMLVWLESYVPAQAQEIHRTFQLSKEKNAWH